MFSKKNKGTPIWFMRQAGRSLPEYRKLRLTKPNFLEFCYDPKAAMKATLQPIKRFGFDAAIIFSDILVIPDALGKKVWFEEGVGPQLEIWDLNNLPHFDTESFLKHLSPVYEALSLTKERLPQGTDLIGFAGAPWTIATYCIEGKGSKTYDKTKSIAYNNEKSFSKLIDLLVDAITLHLIKQIEAGAQIVQIFDSWAGTLDEDNFNKWCTQPIKRIIRSVKKKHPNVPIIAFPRLAGVNYKVFVDQVDMDCLGIDSNISLTWVNNNISKDIFIQGNLDPMYLLSEDKVLLKNKVEFIMEKMKGRKHIFNLGHGVTPATPIENIELVIETVRNFK